MLTFTALALVQLEGEDDVLFIAAELTHEAFCLAQLQNVERDTIKAGMWAAPLILQEPNYCFTTAIKKNQKT